MVMMISKRNGESLKKHCRGVVSSLWRYSRTWSSVKRKKKKKLSVFSTGVYERTVICRVVVRLSVWRNLFVDIQTEKEGRRCMIEQGVLSVDHKTRLPASSQIQRGLPFSLPTLVDISTLLGFSRSRLSAVVPPFSNFFFASSFPFKTSDESWR